MGSFPYKNLILKERPFNVRSRPAKKSHLVESRRWRLSDEQGPIGSSTNNLSQLKKLLRDDQPRLAFKSSGRATEVMVRWGQTLFSSHRKETTRSRARSDDECRHENLKVLPKISYNSTKFYKHRTRLARKRSLLRRFGPESVFYFRNFLISFESPLFSLTYHFHSFRL